MNGKTRKNLFSMNGPKFRKLGTKLSFKKKKLCLSEGQLACLIFLYNIFSNTGLWFFFCHINIVWEILIHYLTLSTLKLNSSTFWNKF